MKPSDERIILGCYSLIFGFFGLAFVLGSIVAFKRHSGVEIPSEFPSNANPANSMHPAVALGIGIFLIGLTTAGVRRFWKIRKDYDL